MLKEKQGTNKQTQKQRQSASLRCAKVLLEISLSRTSVTFFGFSQKLSSDVCSRRLKSFSQDSILYCSTAVE